MSADTIIAGLVRRGLPAHVAQGIAANMFQESGYDPGINEIAPLVAGSRGGFGLNQWTGPRRRALEAAAQARGVPVSDLEFQLDYTLEELNGPEANAFRALMETDNAVDAARVYSDSFLRPGIPHMDRRLAEAARLAGMDYTPQQQAPTQARSGPQTAPGENALAALLQREDAATRQPEPRRNALSYMIDPAAFMGQPFAPVMVDFTPRTRLRG